MSDDLRSKVIRLAHTKPELRSVLLPLVKEASEIRNTPSEWDPEFDKASTNDIDAILKVVFGPRGWSARNDADGRKIVNIDPKTKKVTTYKGKGWSDVIRKAAIGIGLTQEQFRARIEKGLSKTKSVRQPSRNAPPPAPSTDDVLKIRSEETPTPPGWSRTEEREGQGTLHITMESPDKTTKLLLTHSFVKGMRGQDYSALYKWDPEAPAKVFNTSMTFADSAVEDLLKKINAFKKTLSMDLQKMLDDYLSKIHYPGFSRREEKGWHNGLEGDFPSRGLYPSGSVILTNEDDTVRVAVNVSIAEDYKTQEPEIKEASGHTWFKKPGKQGWFGFDRRGVEDSFYLKNSNDFQSEMKEQLEKIEKAIARDATMIDVPGIPFRITPETLELNKKLLAQGRPVYFKPGGFGTGYTVTTTPTRYSKPLPAEAAALFEVPRLFFETFDHD